MACHLDFLNMLATPIWIAAPESEELIFANHQAQTLSGGASLETMRNGEFSAVALSVSDRSVVFRWDEALYQAKNRGRNKVFAA